MNLAERGGGKIEQHMESIHVNVNELKNDIVKLRITYRICSSGCVRQTNKRETVHLSVCETDQQAAGCVPPGV